VSLGALRNRRGDVRHPPAVPRPPVWLLQTTSPLAFYCHDKWRGARGSAPEDADACDQRFLGASRATHRFTSMSALPHWNGFRLSVALHKCCPGRRW